jgi:hypothetical protein
MFCLSFLFSEQQPEQKRERLCRLLFCPGSAELRLLPRRRLPRLGQVF